VRYLLLARTDGTRTTVPPPPTAIRGGRLIAGGRLPPVVAAVVRVRTDGISISEGPCPEGTGDLAGFWLIDARDLNDAVRIAASLPAARTASIEVRPVSGPHPPPP
jgi:hypothetical protein